MDEFRRADAAWYDLLKKHIERRMTLPEARALRKRIDSEYQTLCEAERDKLFAQQVKERDALNPLDFLPLPSPNKQLALICVAFGIDEDREPFDAELGHLTRYVRLTILHDKMLKRPTTEPINNGIWPEAEDWASDFWKDIIRGACDLDVAAEMRSDFETVKAELPSKAAAPPGGGAESGRTGETKETKDETGIVGVTLTEFMSHYCEDPPTGAVLDSRKNSLLKGNLRGKITLPKPVGKWESGKPKRFDPEALIANWPAYRQFNSNLPLLKARTN